MNNRKTLDTWGVVYKGFDDNYNLVFEGFTNMYTEVTKANKVALYNNRVASENGINIIFDIEYRRREKSEYLLEQLEKERTFSRTLAERFSKEFY